MGKGAIWKSRLQGTFVRASSSSGERDTVIQYLIWDAGGTLFDTYPAVVEACRVALRGFGAEAPSEWVMALCKQTTSYGLRTLAETYRLNEDVFKQQFSQTYDDIEVEYQPPFPGVERVCDYICAIGGQNFIVTHRSRASLEALLEAHAMAHYFTDCIAKEDPYPRKPDPAAYNALIGRYNLDRDRCLAIGDRDIDIVAGQRAGIRTCFFGIEPHEAQTDLAVTDFRRCTAGCWTRMETFDAALLSAYRKHPCRVLPNALWKTLAETPNYTCTFVVDLGRVTQLQMRRDDALLLYWRADRALPQFSDVVWPCLTSALLHDDFIGAVPPGALPSREAYFRLQRNTANLSDVALPQGFDFVDAQVDDEAVSIADFITGCYEAIALGADDVRGWSQLPVFAPDLAFWIVDVTRGIPAALAVSHFDARVPEVSLEWVQVHPNYRGRGLGTALVRETLRRARDHANLVTVSGAVANRHRPAALYRRCGFTGDDVWWVLRR